MIVKSYIGLHQYIYVFYGVGQLLHKQQESDFKKIILEHFNKEYMQVINVFLAEEHIGCATLLKLYLTSKTGFIGTSCRSSCTLCTVTLEEIKAKALFAATVAAVASKRVITSLN